MYQVLGARRPLPLPRTAHLAVVVSEFVKEGGLGDNRSISASGGSPQRGGRQTAVGTATAHGGGLARLTARTGLERRAGGDLRVLVRPSGRRIAPVVGTRAAGVRHGVRLGARAPSAFHRGGCEKRIKNFLAGGAVVHGRDQRLADGRAKFKFFLLAVNFFIAAGVEAPAISL